MADRARVQGYRVAKRLLVGVAAAALALAAAQAASADPAGGAGGGDAANLQALSPVVVTARKRAEVAQGVPTPLTAISNAALRDMGADSFSDFARTVPSLAFIDAGPGIKKVLMRGVSDGASVSSNVQATVAQYIDDIPVSEGAQQPDLKLFDINRVEVLRGPQGTLYGAGSMGGAIRVVTNKADPNHFSALLDGTVSGTNKGGVNYAADGMVNIPLVSDVLALRAVGYYRNFDGFIDDRVTHKNNVNTEETSGGRLSLRFAPTDKLEVTLNAMAQRMVLGGRPVYSENLGDLISVAPVSQFQKDTFFIFNGTVNYDLNWARLTSSTSYYRARRDYQYDDTEGATISTEAYLGPYTPNPDVAYTPGVNKDSTFSQEIRLASPGKGPLDWLVGFYYERQTFKAVDDIIEPAVFPYFDPTNYFGIYPSVFHENVYKESEQYAGFGELTYHLNSAWAATVGWRVFGNSYSRVQTLSGVANGISDGHLSDYSNTSTHSTGNTPKFQLTYKPTSDVLIYGGAAKGYRAGGVNPAVPFSIPGVTVPVAFQSDSLWNYELGAKTSWLDNRLIVNGAIYYIDWDNIQSAQVRADGFAYVANAGKAHSEGVELEAHAVPVRGLEIGGSFSYTDAVLDRAQPSLGATKGEALPGVPHLLYSYYGQYTRPLYKDLDGYARLDVQYVGKSQLTFLNTPTQAIGDYATVNLRVGISQGGWDLKVFADNLLDKRARLTAQHLLTELVTVNRPRTVGVTLSKRFN